VTHVTTQQQYEELGRLLIEMYNCDPKYWYNMLPVVVVARIQEMEQS